MGFLPNYSYDVFLSYVGDDNTVIGPVQSFVSVFASDLKKVLRTRLGVREDDGLSVCPRPGVVDEIEPASRVDMAANSAIFVALLSPNYTKSNLTLSELAAFKAGRDTADDVFAVELSPLEPAEEYPALVRSAARVAFWSRGADETLQPLAPGSERYLETLFDLCESIRKRLKRLCEASNAALIPTRLHSPDFEGGFAEDANPFAESHLERDILPSEDADSPSVAAYPSFDMAKTAKIVISYRRDDSEDTTGRIYDRLVDRYGATSVFMDIDSIPFGVDFRTYIARELQGCHIVLAVVGPAWLGEVGNRRRIDDESDFVRIEIEAALKRDILLIPILVRKAELPKPEDLPEPLKSFAYRHAARVASGADFRDHMARLIRSIDKHLSTLGVSVR